MEIKTLAESPTLAEFSQQVREAEDGLNRYEVAAYDLELYPKGTLAVKGRELDGEFLFSEKVYRDLSRIAEIPAPYFEDCDPELKSLSFNRRLRKKVPEEKPLQVVVRDDVIVRVLNLNLLPAPRWPILDTISNSIPDNIAKEELRVIKHAWGEQFDISVISPDLTCAPQKGDVIAFGIAVFEGEKGAIQVQGATFRCWCSNGAINRICDAKKHRIRRPINQLDREQQFLLKIHEFAQDAWRLWEDNAKALVQLKNVALDSGYSDALRLRLRQAPFFLSLRVINQVLDRLAVEVREHDGGLSMYDLWNAMTYLGTHDTELSPTYRSRLRLGAGEFTRNKSKFCKTCSQLVVS